MYLCIYTLRCACNGHAGRCGTDINSVCVCLHNTEGDNCERCLPFYNDKPWRYGATNNAFPCKPCNCNNHATRCHYNASVDPFPNSYEVGGGGVCDDCQDNTGKGSSHRFDVTTRAMHAQFKNQGTCTFVLYLKVVHFR